MEQYVQFSRHLDDAADAADDGRTLFTRIFSLGRLFGSAPVSGTSAPSSRASAHAPAALSKSAGAGELSAQSAISLNSSNADMDNLRRILNEDSTKAVATSSAGGGDASKVGARPLALPRSVSQLDTSSSMRSVWSESIAQMESAAAPQKAVGSSVPIWDHLSAEEKGMIVELKVRRKDGKEAFWMPDAAQSACYHCATPFSIFLRRHHCRLCGHIFCADCLQTTVASVYVEDNATANATSKVCDFCARILSHESFLGENMINRIIERLERRDYKSDVDDEELVSATHDASAPKDIAQPLRLPRVDARPVASSPEPSASEHALTREQSASEIAKKPKKPRASMPFTAPPRTKALARATSMSARKLSVDDVLKPRADAAHPPPPAPAQDEPPAQVAQEQAQKEDQDAQQGEGGEHRRSESSGVRAALHASRAEVRVRLEAHLPRLVQHFLRQEHLDAHKWAPTLVALTRQAASLLIPKSESPRDPADIRTYVKVKYIPGGAVEESRYISGLVFDKNRTHRKMKTAFQQPRIMLFTGPLEYRPQQGVAEAGGALSPLLPGALSNTGAGVVGSVASAGSAGSAGGAAANGVASAFVPMDELLAKETAFLTRLVADIAAKKPDVVFVEKAVARKAQELFLEHGITLVLNVKPRVMKILSRITKTPIYTSLVLSSWKEELGTCESLRIESYTEPDALSSSAFSAPSVVSAPAPVAVSRDARRQLSDAEHDEQMIALLRDPERLATPVPAHSPHADPQRELPSSRAASEGDGASVGARRACVFVEGCPPHCFATLVLRGAESHAEFVRVKRVTRLCAALAYHLHLELALFTHLNAGLLPHTPHPPVDAGLLVPTSPLLRFASRALPTQSQSVALPYLAAKPHVPSLVLTSEVPHGAIDTAEGAELGGGADAVLPLRFDYRSVRHAVTLDADAEDAGVSAGVAQVALQERLVYVHSLFCASSSTLCIPHELHLIDFYSFNDLSLGQFLRWFCFDEKLACSATGCGKDMLDHERSFLHGTGRVNVLVKEWLATSSAASAAFKFNGEQDDIGVWDQCPDKHAKPVFVALDASVLRYSFGKYLELLFYGSELLCTTCGTPTRVHTRYFYCNNKVAIFEYEPLRVAACVLPPLRYFTHAHAVTPRAPTLAHASNKESTPRHERTASEKSAEEADVGSGEPRARASDGAYTVDAARVRQARAELSVLQSSAVKVYAEIVSRLHAFIALVESADSSGDSARAAQVEQLLQDLATLEAGQKMEFDQWRTRISTLFHHEERVDLSVLDVYALHKDLFEVAVAWHDTLTQVVQRIWDVLTTTGKLLTVSHTKKLLPTSLVTVSSSPSTTQSASLGAGLVEASSNSATQAVPATAPTPLFSGTPAGEAASLPPTPSPRTSLSASAEIVPESALEPPTRDADSPRQRVAPVDEAAALVLPRIVTSTAHTGDASAAAPSVPSSFSSAASVSPTASSVSASPLPGSSPSATMKTLATSSTVGGGGASVALSASGSVPKTFGGNVHRLDHHPAKINDPPLPMLLTDAAVHIGLPSGYNGVTVFVRAKEPSTIIAHVLSTYKFHADLNELKREVLADSTVRFSVPDADVDSTDPIAQKTFVLHPLNSTITMSVSHEAPFDGKSNFSCVAHYALQFATFRQICGISDNDFVLSLSRSQVFNALGGKSKSSFTKTLDERFILKKINKVELDSFLEFAPQYFDYMYKYTTKAGTRKKAKYLIVMENLFYGHKIVKSFDLKGSQRARKATDELKQGNVLLDENLLELLYAEPMCVDIESKSQLGMAVWNDSLFLAALNVMDYSLLVGVDEQNNVLVCGVIDYLRRYTWDKSFESWVKKTGMLTGGRVPTIISPKQYKKRFRYAIWMYFPMVPRKDIRLLGDVDEREAGRGRNNHKEAPTSAEQ